MVSEIKKILGKIVFLVVGVFIVSSIAAYADWAPPVKDPPVCVTGQAGCDPPVNVSSNFQDKSGGLWVGSSAASGTFLSRGTFESWSATYLATTGGNVGIGTAAPANKLQVQGKIQANAGDVCTSLGGPSGKCLSQTSVITAGGNGVAGRIPKWASPSSSGELIDSVVEEDTLSPRTVTVRGNLAVDGAGTRHFRAPHFRADATEAWARADNFNIDSGGQLYYNGQPAMLIGGFYSFNNRTGNCQGEGANPLTGGCSCPVGFTASQVGRFEGPSGVGDGNIFFYVCWR